MTAGSVRTAPSASHRDLHRYLVCVDVRPYAGTGRCRVVKCGQPARHVVTRIGGGRQWRTCQTHLHSTRWAVAFEARKAAQQ